MSPGGDGAVLNGINTRATLRRCWSERYASGPYRMLTESERFKCCLARCKVINVILLLLTASMKAIMVMGGKPCPVRVRLNTLEQLQNRPPEPE
ncbi:hypothetical protein ZHAS_00006629 [Anopheles sinensis]|uniref:Uncharacterized protein n=1 Tax=Anopheles sinensis TaxID=74873 RepID=A0A084VMT3_ANOSI|nr:hypothetical protein ZHAS_00006629 [Anopheles sinensis]